MLAPRLALAIAVVVATAAVALSCGRLAVKRKDEGKKSEPTATATEGGEDGVPGDVTTDACAREPLENARCGEALMSSIAETRDMIDTVAGRIGPESMDYLPSPNLEEVIAFLDEVARVGTFKTPTARYGAQAGLAWSFLESGHWHLSTASLSIIREPGNRVRVATATTRLGIESFTNEGWTAESLTVDGACRTILIRATRAFAVWQGKVMEATCEGALYTDFVGDNALTTASSFKLALSDDPKTAMTPAFEANPYCDRMYESTKYGSPCASTVAAIRVGAYGDPALWVTPKELKDLKTQVEPVP